MLKKTIVLIAVSTIVIFSMSYAQQAVQLLLEAHNWISQLLTDVFSGGEAGNIARGLIALLCIPFLVGLAPTIVYWAAKRHVFPYFMDIVWIVWLVQVGALLVMSQATTLAVTATGA